MDLSEYDRKSNMKYFIDHFLCMSLYPLINKPTLIIHGCHFIIDNIFIHVLDKDLSSGVIIDDTSDHCPIFCCTNFVMKNEKVSTLIFHRMNNDKAKKKNFNHVLELENWNPAYYATNVDDAFDNFVHIFMNHYNRCCSLKQVTKSKQSADKMWFTDGLKNACGKKKKLYTNYVKDPTLKNEKKYKHYKNKLTSILRNSEKLYYGNELEKAKLDKHGRF